MSDTHCATPQRVPGGLPALPMGRDAVPYLLVLEARYLVARCPVVRGKAETQAISNSRLVIRAEHELEPSEWIQLYIQWPMRRDGVWPMNLVVGGEVVRSQDGLAEIAIREYDLRPIVT